MKNLSNKIQIGKIARRLELLNSYKSAFDIQYGSDDDCLAALYCLLENAGLDVRMNCSCTLLDCESEKVLASCDECNSKKIALAVESLINAKAPKTSLFVLWLMSRNIRVTCGDLNRLMGTPKSSAAQILNKLNKFEETSPLLKPIFLNLMDYKNESVNEAEVTESDEKTTDRDSPQYANSAPVATITEQDEDSIARQILKLIGSDPISFETVCQLANISTQVGAATLLKMELDLLVERLPGSFYKKRIRQSVPQERETMPKNNQKTSNACAKNTSSEDSITIVIKIARGGIAKIETLPFIDGTHLNKNS